MPKPKSGTPAAGRWQYAGHEKQPVRLVRRGDSPRFYVEYPDKVTGYPVRESTKTADEAAAVAFLNDTYRKLYGSAACFCSECGAPKDAANREVLSIIDEYLGFKKRVAEAAPPRELKKALEGVQSLRCRLNLVERFIATRGNKVFANSIDDSWAADFRIWALSERYLPTNGKTLKQRSRGTVEHSLVQLRAAYNHCREPFRFKPGKHSGMSKTTQFRADVEHIAKLFEYCLYPRDAAGVPLTGVEQAASRSRRSRLLAFLRLSVVSWGRPEAVAEADFDPARGQWDRRNRVFFLNPRDRTQNDKARAMIPVPDNAVGVFDSFTGRPAEGISLPTFKRAALYAGFPAEGYGEAGMKQLRRALATLAKVRLTKLEFETQGKAMLAHSMNASVSSLYAPDEPATLHRDLEQAAAVMSDLIDEIEALCPGSFNLAYGQEDGLGGNVVAMPRRAA